MPNAFSTMTRIEECLRLYADLVADPIRRIPASDKEYLRM